MTCVQQGQCNLALYSRGLATLERAMQIISSIACVD